VCLSPGWSFLGLCLVLQAAERLFKFCFMFMCVGVWAAASPPFQRTRFFLGRETTFLASILYNIVNIIIQYILYIYLIYFVK